MLFILCNKTQNIDHEVARGSVITGFVLNIWRRGSCVKKEEILANITISFSGPKKYGRARIENIKVKRSKGNTDWFFAQLPPIFPLAPTPFT